MNSTTTEMRRSWLVQRLEKPRGRGVFQDNPFSFGGGYKNGGLSDDAMNVLRPIFSFDYMGAAEFEFGAVPKALNLIARAAHNKPRKSGLTAFSFEVALADVPPNWQSSKTDPDPEGAAPIYVLCLKEQTVEIEARIRAWATGDERLKEPTRLTNALRPFHDWDTETCGWLELDNGFMFFADRDMWVQTCAAFGVEVSA